MRLPSGPALVGRDEWKMRSETVDNGFRVAIVIDGESHGSDVLLGLQWVESGTEVVSWRAGEHTHEVYHLVQGALQIGWASDGVARCADLAVGDSFFFPPAHDYSVVNTGDQAAFVVWAMTPSDVG